MKSGSRVDDMIGAQTLLRVGQLQGADAAEFFLAHAGAGEDALALLPGRGGDDDDAVESALTMGFEQQRDIQHHQLS